MTTTTRKARTRKARPRAPKGSGTIRQRPGSSTFTAMWREEGRNRSRGGFATHDDARAFLDRTLAALSTTTSAGGVTVERAVAAFLAVVEQEVERGDRKRSTLSSLRNTLAYVERDRALSGALLRDVTGRDLGTFYDRLRKSGAVRTGRGVGEGTVRAVHKSVSAMLSHYVETGAIVAASNPVREVPSRQRARATSKARQSRDNGGDAVTSWSWEVVADLLDRTAADPTPERVACCLMAAGSLRVGEVCGLTWSDVDLDGFDGVGFVHVRRTLTVVDGHVVEGTPKTDTSVRRVPLVTGLRSVLDAWRRSQRETLLAAGHRVTRTTPVVAWQTDSRPVARGRGVMTLPGDPYRADTLSRRVRDTLTALDLPPVDGAHALRHVFGFVFVNEPVDGLRERLPATDVAAMMGHADVSVTLTTYNRVDEGRVAARFAAGRRVAV